MRERKGSVEGSESQGQNTNIVRPTDAILMTPAIFISACAVTSHASVLQCRSHIFTSPAQLFTYSSLMDVHMSSADSLNTWHVMPCYSNISLPGHFNR